LPVQAPTKYELVVNLGTVKALGLTMSDVLLACAGVIEYAALRPLVYLLTENQKGTKDDHEILHPSQHSHSG
jgi:hypothetical protein